MEYVLLLLILLIAFLVLRFLTSMVRHSTSLRRGAIIWSSVFCGAAVGPAAGFIYLRLYDSRPGAKIESLLIMGLLGSLWAIGGGMVAVMATKDRE
jgi:Trk-type K+ transport system membrane component